MESRTQNPEFRNDPENFHQCECTFILLLPKAVPSRSRRARTTLDMSENWINAYADTAPCRFTSTSYKRYRDILHLLFILLLWGNIQEF